jgi:hypothetical protein
MNRKRSVSSAVGALVAAAIVGGVAYATIPGPGNVYSACMLKGLGTIRLIDKSLPATNLMSHCTDKETEVSWNQAGQPGAPGPQGVKGDKGDAGLQGIQGEKGDKGDKGERGDQGLQGIQGSSGEKGDQGLQGIRGEKGDKGDKGDPGTSVMSAIEPAGTNCASGGSKFTVANAVTTYACNGTPGTGGGSGWSLGGNAGTNPSTDYLGTSDNQPLNFAVNGVRALRLEPGAVSSAPPNVVAGSSANNAGTGVSGATISGGGPSSPSNPPNTVLASFGTVGGGSQNVSGSLATVGGGGGNTASGRYAVVAGGSGNTASGFAASIAGGGGNTASADNSFVAGGTLNSADARGSFAGGTLAKAAHTGAFVWADFHIFLTPTGDAFIPFASTSAHEFAARATGGVRFVSGVDGSGDTTAGVSLAPGSGSWSSLSDRALKRNFVPIEGRSVLERIAGLPISTWSYKAQKPSIRHLGPTAQDFSRAFDLGEDDRHIDTIDSEGVSLAGVQALYELVQAQQRQLREQRNRLDLLEQEVARLERGAR